MYNPDRIYLNYSCVDNAHLSDDECAALVKNMKAQSEAKSQHKRVEQVKSQAKKWPINTKCDTWREPQIKKIVAQWNALANHGEVQDRSLEACRVFCEKATGVSRLEWFTTNDFNVVIERLKKWQERVGCTTSSV